jgi:response regulator RpfG family c-di-GMP phosphodiesterase
MALRASPQLRITAIYLIVGCHALIHERVYKPAWPERDVLAYISDQAGSHFDPRLARRFVERCEAIKARAGVHDAFAARAAA